MKNEKSALFNVLKSEMKTAEPKVKQAHVSAAVDKQTGNLWNMIRSNSIKFSILVKICDFLGLEIIIRNPAKNCEYKLNSKKK